MLTKITQCDNSQVIADIEAFTEHSRITDLYDELVVQQCLDAAHDLVQKWLNRMIYPSRVIAVSDEYQREVFLPYPNIKTVYSVKAEDSDYNEAYFTKDVDWKFDEVTQTVRFLQTTSSQYHRYSRFTYDYSCGYDQECDPVPAAVKHAILMTAATLYENREDTIVGTQINEVPLNSQRLLQVHRIRTQQ
ncbi:head-tail connector protein [Vibrio phage 3.058.O._10N.286.46.B8]|nr:head-tail connector protein [Vibrio phage 2.058.O._10N.286.46.B8]AUS03078.1 head-tail connector protein [Vibrio phage 3.058.O._10N.286.46.B8]